MGERGRKGEREIGEGEKQRAGAEEERGVGGREGGKKNAVGIIRGFVSDPQLHEED